MAATSPKPEPIETTVGHANAPIIYFDGTSVHWFNGNIGSIALVTFIPVPMSDGTIKNQMVTVANLKANLDGLKGLKETIERILLAASKPEGQAN